MNKEFHLAEKIKNIIFDADKNVLADNIEILEECYKTIVENKNIGLTQFDAYDELMVLYKSYDKKNMEIERDFVADVLDIICGNIGNKKWLIWNEYYNGKNNK